MIAFVRGRLAEITGDGVVLECGGLGYMVYVPTTVLDILPAIGSEVKLHTYLQVKEDGIALFGFAEKSDLDLFKRMITVSGIGPKGALSILSVLPGDDLRFAIVGGDAKAIARANGIGLKTAQKLILELKDKVTLEEAVDVKRETVRKGSAGAASGAKSDAIEVLTALGFSASEALKAVNGLTITEEMTAEDIVSKALGRIGIG